MDLPATICLGKRPDGTPLEFPVERPTSDAIMFDIVMLQYSNHQRAAAAACGVCSPKLARELRVRYNGNASEYGGAVIDAFMKTARELGIKAGPFDIVKAGLPLVSEFTASAVSAEEVIATEGFTDPTPAGSTS
jgi:hypothetical protein